MRERAAGSEARTRGAAQDPRRWRILGVSLVVGFMVLLDVTIVNVALPSMQEGLGSSPAAIQWVVSGYALSFGLTLVAGGRLGDAYGRRRMMAIGLIGFVVASAAVGLAPNTGLLVLARLIQGATAGLVTPQNSGLIQQLFSGHERGKAFGVFGFTMSIASATGPVLGGLILALAGPENGWRYLFLINVPIGLVALALIMKMVPGRLTEDRGEARIDVIGAILLGGFVVSVLFPVVSVETGTYWALCGLLAAPALGWAFVRWERRTVARGRPPLLDLALLRRIPGYAGGLTIGTLYFTGFTGLLLVTSYYLQRALGIDPLAAGLLIAPFAVGAAVSSPIAGRLVGTIGRRITVIALVLVSAGLLLLATLLPLPDRADVWTVTVPVLLLAGLGGGAVVSPNMTLTLADVPPRMGGAAGGALQTGQRIGAAIGAAAMMTVYSATTEHLGAGSAVRLALLTGLVLMAAALVMAVRDTRHDH